MANALPDVNLWGAQFVTKLAKIELLTRDQIRAYTCFLSFCTYWAKHYSVKYK